MSSQHPSTSRNSESSNSFSDDFNVGRGGSNVQTHPSFDNVNLFPHQTPPRRSHSETSSSRPQYYAHRENDLPPLPQPEMSTESRRQSMMAIDRKRRLTASTYDGGRRRTTTEGFTSRDNRFHATPNRHQSHGQEGPRGNTDVREVIDLTGSSPPVQHSPLPSRPAPRRTSNSSRSYIVPRWQPDAEVSECPICHRQFTLWFRRHHCRKCGRVVCNECSPHRITIPRQYIVQPPGDEEGFFHALSIDLTRSDDDNNDVYGASGGTSRRFNSALGGGEKVRLCNPCVPDPQPENQALFEQLSRAQQQQSSNPPSLPTLPSSLSGMNQRQPVYGNQNLEQLPHPGTRVNLSMSMDNEDSTLSPEAYISAPRHHVMQALASSSQPYPAFGPAHSRYYSLDASRGPLPPLPPFGNRARIYSGPQQFGASGITLPQGPQRPSHQQPSGISLVQRPSRPRIREEDMCPICRGGLPPKGLNGDETDRENHIMDCISRHDPSAPLSTSRQRTDLSEPNLSSSLPAPNTTSTSMPSSSSVPHPARIISTQMVRFIATEKDCIAVSVPGEDEPQPQECSICMVEYEVGDQLARLECWCKFHQECIVEWFGRKRECPVHKIS